jgi:hypothetical protein
MKGKILTKSFHALSIFLELLLSIGDAAPEAGQNGLSLMDLGTEGSVGNDEVHSQNGQLSLRRRTIILTGPRSPASRSSIAGA